MDNNTNCKMIKTTSKNNIINLDHVYCNTNDNKYNSEKTISVCKEIKQLQSILILHLDLIQEQNDQLINKDKLLSTLKKENESLKSKVSQLEQDMVQLQKKIEEEISKKEKVIREKREPEVKIKQEPEITIVDDETITITEIVSKSPPINLPPPPVINKIVIHRIPNSQPNNSTNPTNKKAGASGIGSSDSYKSSIVENEKFIIKSSPSTTPTSTPVVTPVKNDKTPQRASSSTSPVPGTDLKYLSDNFMTTRKPYITCNWKHKVVDETNSEETLKIINLEVPSWREITFTDSGAGVKKCENTSCDVFLKRHLKYEIDEKRRKKWDVQRIREQKNIEKLKKRHFKEQMQESGGLKNNTQEIDSFYPSSECIEYIHITEHVDVAAFGEQIPLLSPTDFTLPWLAKRDSGCPTSFSSLSMGPKSKFLQLNPQNSQTQPERKKIKHN